MPVKVGVWSFEGLAGVLSVTFGEEVSTTKMTGLLWPFLLPSELGSLATAV